MLFSSVSAYAYISTKVFLLLLKLELLFKFLSLSIPPSIAQALIAVPVVAVIV